MASWLLRAFTGEQPRVSENLLPSNAAAAAENTRLDSGDLTPLREPQFAYAFPAYPGYQTIYRHLDAWLGWTGVVHCAPGPVATDRLYITGDGVPKMRVGVDEYPLAVPAPTAGLSSAVTGTGSGDTITSVFVYTFVTAFGEESEPSAASADVVWQAGQTVTISGFQAAPAGRNITLQRIYRTQTGSSGTDLYFIAKRAASAANFVDTVGVEDFGEVLPSRAYNAPPDNLQGIISMPNGMMAAFVGRDIYFCEPYQPHAWPQVYSLTVDYDIVALGSVGSSLIVMTEGYPYLVQGTDPTSMQMVKIESNLPCINARGVQDMGTAIAYPSHEGLVLADAGGGVRVVTENLFNRDDWQKLNPGLIRAGQLSGRYFAAFDSTDANGQPYAGTIIIHGQAAPAFLTRSSVIADAFFYDLSEGALYFVEATGQVKRFDPPTGPPINQYWRSRPLLLPFADNFGAIFVDGEATPTVQELANIEAASVAAIAANELLLDDPLGSELNGAPINEYAFAGDNLEAIPGVAKIVSISILADGVPVASIGIVGRPTRLPSGFRARKWEIGVFGTTTIRSVAVARTMADLKAMGASL